jgi:hypothetical protein
VPAIVQAWGVGPVRIDRIGPRDVALRFPDTPCAVLVDPTLPAQLLLAKRVLEAWQRDGQPPPQRLDARVTDRVAVLPAPALEASPS